MPLEYVMLKDRPIYLDWCPSCGARPFKPFLRGQVQTGLFGGGGWIERLRAWWYGHKPHYCGVICHDCKRLVGYESSDGAEFEIEPECLSG